jgi:hypothetical protein
MQRHEMIAAMSGLGLKGMAGAFDEAVTTGLQRKRTVTEILTDLLQAEAAHPGVPVREPHGVAATPPPSATA